MNNDSHEDLTRSVRSFRVWIQGLAAVVLGAYLSWFAIHLDSPLSQQVEAWGQFGDFVGGLLNPLIAYAAFHWITRSVLIQGKELADTRAALREAATAQATQAAHAGKSLGMVLLRARIDAIASNIQLKTKELEFVAEQFAKHSGNFASHTLDGGIVPGSVVSKHLAEKHLLVNNLMLRRDELLDEMAKLLAS